MPTRVCPLSLQGRAHLTEAGLCGCLSQAAGLPAVLPDLALQLGAPGDHGRVAVAGQLGMADQVAELTQLGEDGRRLRVGGRTHRPDPERLRPGPFQPGEHQRRGFPVQRQPQASVGQVRAERGGAGLQVDAAEPTAPGLHHGQARPELGQRRPGPPFPLRQLGPDQSAQQADGQRHLRSASAHRREPSPGFIRTPGREQSAGREQLGHVRVVGQPAAAQPLGQQQRLGSDGRPAAP